LSNTYVRKKRIVDGLVYIALIFFSLIAVFPLFWLISSSLRSGTEIFSPVLWPKNVTFEAYQYTLRYFPFLDWFRNSTLISLSATAISVFVSSLAAYSLSRFSSRGKQLLSRGILLAYMFPGVLFILPMFVLFHRIGLLDTKIGLIAAYSMTGLPFAMWLLTAYFETIPREIDEAARIDGASNFQVYWRVVMPVAKPGLATAAIFAFINAWNEFLLALILINSDSNKTLPVGLYAQMGGKAGEAILWNVRMASSVMVILPMLIIFLVLNKQITRGLTAGALKG
jgi:multiple sugar transport system permease protein